ncbi:MAG: hypothetical protein ISR54_03545 [Chlorobium phaeobacteroides]|nr:hypothetical protein [Chlorobium phaeobacteroides]
MQRENSKGQLEAAKQPIQLFLLLPFDFFAFILADTISFIDHSKLL